MACQGCSSDPNPSFFSYPLGQTNPCAECANTVDSMCVTYTGPALQCIGTGTNLALQDLLVEMDSIICNITVGDGYDPDWDTSCLVNLTEGPIVTMQEFVESISSYVCTLRTDLDTFIDTTYPADQQIINNTLLSILNPNTTACVYSGVDSLDSLHTVLNKLSSSVCSLFATLSLTGVDWDQCFTISPDPTNLVDGFNTVIDMICQVQASIPAQVVLPTFDNSANCLAGTLTDSLVTTVTDITNLLCTKPDFSPGDIEVDCLDIDTTSLQTIVQDTITQVSTLAGGIVNSFDPLYFSTSMINPLDPCEGLFLTFTGALVSTDDKVAFEPGDPTPGSLQEKVAAGDNITLDFGVDNPGQMTIHSTDEFVKASVTDTTPGYLINKIDVKPDATGSIDFAETYNVGTEKVDITPTIDFTNMANEILIAISGSVELQALFCGLACGCMPCTTTTTGGEGLMSIQLVNIDGDDTEVTFSASQNSPSVTFVSGLNITLSATQTFTTGSYALTDPAPATATIAFTNNNATEFAYDISVEDGLGNPVPGATSTSGSLSASSTYTDAAFSFGTSPTGDYVLIITFDKS